MKWTFIMLVLPHQKLIPSTSPSVQRSQKSKYNSCRQCKVAYWLSEMVPTLTNSLATCNTYSKITHACPFLVNIIMPMWKQVQWRTFHHFLTLEQQLSTRCSASDEFTLGWISPYATSGSSFSFHWIGLSHILALVRFFLHCSNNS